MISQFSTYFFSNSNFISRFLSLIQVVYTWYIIPGIYIYFFKYLHLLKSIKTISKVDVLSN